MRAKMLLSATSNGVGVNVRLVGYGLSVSRYQGIYTPLRQQHRKPMREPVWARVLAFVEAAASL
jgi:hypothetical protein